MRCAAYGGQNVVDNWNVMCHIDRIGWYILYKKSYNEVPKKSFVGFVSQFS
jgi:hypothetical protein